MDPPSDVHTLLPGVLLSDDLENLGHGQEKSKYRLEEGRREGGVSEQVGGKGGGSEREIEVCAWGGREKA